MSENRHTPGPWTIEDYASPTILGRPIWPCTYNGENGLWGVATVDDLMGDRPAEVAANASLIAAAPDLLEALKRLESTARILPPHLDEPGSALFDARAAIAKATGSASWPPFPEL